MTYDEGKSDPQDPYSGSGIPSGYRINPETGQLEPIPVGNPFGVNPAAPVAPPVGTAGTYQLGSPNDPNRNTSGGETNPFNLTAPFTGTAPAVPNGTGYLPPTPSYTAPTFTPPTYQKPPSFELPTYAQAENDPGYQFTRGQGEQALQQSAAARGLANTGGTAKDLINYGQAAGTTQYSNVLNRMLQQYLTNVTTQYNQPYDYAYRSAVDSFAPQMAQFQANVGAGNLGYSTQAAAGQRNQEFNYNALYDQYLQNINNFRDQRDSTYNKIHDVLNP